MKLISTLILSALVHCCVSFTIRHDTINYEDVLDALENMDEKCGADLDDSLRDAFGDWRGDTHPPPETTANDPAFRAYLTQVSDWTHSLCECQAGQTRYASVLSNFKSMYPGASTDALISTSPPTLPELPSAEECHEAKVRHDQEDEDDDDDDDDDDEDDHHHHHHCRDANGNRTDCAATASTSTSPVQSSPVPTDDSVQFGDPSPGIRNVVNSGAVESGARAFALGIVFPAALGLLLV